MIVLNLNGAGRALEDNLGEDGLVGVEAGFRDEPISVLEYLSGEGCSK